MKNSATIIMLGDLSLHGGYAPENGATRPLLGRDDGWLHSADLVISNLECTLRAPERPPGKRIRVAADSASLNRLAELNVGVATLANNHVFDHGASGFRAVRDRLQTLGIVSCGAGESPQEAARPVIVERNGQRIGVLAFCADETTPFVPAGLHLNRACPGHVAESVGRIRAGVDTLIVSLHWGLEWLVMPSPRQRELAHEFIRAGADVIVGHHSHAVQGWERVGSGCVFYSLGNALFDDVFDGDRLLVRQNALTRRIGVARVEADGRRILNAELRLGGNHDGISFLKPAHSARGVRAANRSLALRFYPARYAVHRTLQSFVQRYVGQYLFGLGPAECLRRLAAKALRRDGPLVMFGAGGKGGYFVRTRRLLQSLHALYPDQRVLLAAPLGDPLLREALPPNVTARASRLAACGMVGRVLWLNVGLPIMCLRHRARCVVGLACYAPRWALCNRVVMVNNARLVSPLFDKLPGIPRLTRFKVRCQRFFFGMALRGAKRIGVQRKGMMDDIRRRWSIPEDRFILVPSSSSLGNAREPLGDALSLRRRYAGRMVFLCPSLYARHKNLETLAEAARILLVEEPRIEREVVIALTVDSDAPGHEPGAQGFVASLRTGGADRIVALLGEVPHRLMRSLFDEADVLVYPSVCDSFSVVFLDAMECGLPVLAADVPHAREVCGDAAMYFPWNDARALAGCIRDLARSAERREALRVKGSARAAAFPHENELAGSLRLILGEAHVPEGSVAP